METSNFGGHHTVLHAQNDRWGLGPIEIINPGHYVAAVNAQNHRWGLGPLETWNSGAKVALLISKTIGEVWDL